MARYTRSLKKNADHQRVKFGPKRVDCFCGQVDKMWMMKVWTTADTTDVIVPEIGIARGGLGAYPGPQMKWTKNLYNRLSCAKGTNIMQKS